MKTLAILALAIAGFTVAPSASALDFGFNKNKNYSSKSYGHNHHEHCAPVFVCTKEIARSTQCRYAYDHCGRQISYHVTVVTYANYYSDGSYTTFSKTYRA